MSPNKFEGFSKEDLEYLKSEYGYNKRKYKSPGLCSKCGPTEFYETEDGPPLYVDGHDPWNCRNPPFCHYHEVAGHSPTTNCKSYCPHCGKNGHHMSMCRKLKICNLCGKSGHNPYRCWEYSTMDDWMRRAKQLNRCANCLTLCTTGHNGFDQYTNDPKYTCKHCNAWRTYWDTSCNLGGCNLKESQTETKTYTDQESQTELQHVETVMDKSQVNQFKKVAILENELEHCVSVNNNLNSQLLGITQEIQQAHQKANALELACHARDVELIDAKSAVEGLQEQIVQRDLQLEHLRQQLKMQTTKLMAATMQEDAGPVRKIQGKVEDAFGLNVPCPSCTAGAASCKNEHNGQLKQLKASLEDLQLQQQQISMIVTHLYHENRRPIPDTSNIFRDYPSFSCNPYMGVLDTGQNLNKIQIS